MIGTRLQYCAIAATVRAIDRQADREAWQEIR